MNAKGRGLNAFLPKTSHIISLPGIKICFFVLRFLCVKIFTKKRVMKTFTRTLYYIIGIFVEILRPLYNILLYV